MSTIKKKSPIETSKDKKMSPIQIILTKSKTNSPIKPITPTITTNKKIKHKITKSIAKGVNLTYNSHSKSPKFKPTPKHSNNNCIESFNTTQNISQLNIQQSASKDIKLCKSFTPDKLKVITHNEVKKKQLVQNKSFDNLTKKKIDIPQELYSSLNEMEKKEINQFKNDIYFMGTTYDRKQYEIANETNSSKPILIDNDDHKDKDRVSKIRDYNDESGNYQIIKGEQLLFRYEILQLLGKGSFGQAVKCYDHKNKEYVCVKIIKIQKKFYDQSLTEIEILEYLRKNDRNQESNIVILKHHFFFRNHMCLVFELLKQNLYEVLQEHQYVGFDLPTLKKFATQILFSLVFLKSLHIIHCDLKPENILLINKGKTGLKLIDFGSSCFDDQSYYSYIQSRYYRAPEIILGLPYGIEIDMWSFGCILAELYNGYPIFPGENEIDQVYYIMEYLGVPPIEMIVQGKRSRMVFDENNDPILQPNSRGKIRRAQTKTFDHFLKNSSTEFIDLIEKCLDWLPENRIIPEDALHHPWITNEMPEDILKAHKRQVQLFSRKSISRISNTQSNQSSIINPFSIKTERKPSYDNALNDNNPIERLHKVSGSKKSTNRTVNILINLNKSSIYKENA